MMGEWLGMVILWLMVASLAYFIVDIAWMWWKDW